MLPHQRLVLMDVGANNGNYSLKIAQVCSDALRACGITGIHLQLVLFEPNPSLGESLAYVQRQVELLEPSWNVTLVRSAVWTVADEVRKFYVPEDLSVTSSLRRGTNERSTGAAAGEGGHGKAREVMVTTVDLASFLHDNVGTSDVIYMKLDVECAEWLVVPHLIASRALCPIQFIRAEWHFQTHCEGISASTLLGFTEQYLSNVCGDAVPASHSSNSSRFIDLEADRTARRATLPSFVQMHSSMCMHMLTCRETQRFDLFVFDDHVPCAGARSVRQRQADISVQGPGAAEAAPGGESGTRTRTAHGHSGSARLPEVRPSAARRSSSAQGWRSVRTAAALYRVCVSCVSRFKCCELCVHVSDQCSCLSLSEQRPLATR